MTDVGINKTLLLHNSHFRQNEVWVHARSEDVCFDPRAIQNQIEDINHSVLLVRQDNKIGILTAHKAQCFTPIPPSDLDKDKIQDSLISLLGIVPSLKLTNLGNPHFKKRYGILYALLSGAMANGIASVEIVEAMGKAGMMGVFGAAGLSISRVEEAIIQLKQKLGSSPFGVNVIHSPNEGEQESRMVELLLRHQVRIVEASAFLDLSIPIIRYRLAGIFQNDQGDIVVPNRVIVKVSRVEVASKFLAPAPDKILDQLEREGFLTKEQKGWAKRIPVASDLTAEADSGGHTDNRPAITLIPTMIELRDRLQQKWNYADPIHIGAAGGISTPASVAAAFAMGADYVVTGSINQACKESGSSDVVREMLAQAEQADVTMAPAADMFEMGVKLQVLKRGTMFPMRAAKLYEWYRNYPNLEAIPASDKKILETQILRLPLPEIEKQIKDFFMKRDPTQIEKAKVDPKHKMALVFRWYLGQSSRWANSGQEDRRLDFQVWCGPAMGAFNEWTKGTEFAQAKNRDIKTISLNLLYGAAQVIRRNYLNSIGIEIPKNWLLAVPINAAELEAKIRDPQGEKIENADR